MKICRETTDFVDLACTPPLELGLTPSGLFSLRLTFELSISESVCDVRVTRIGDTFSYGFPQTDICHFSMLLRHRTLIHTRRMFFSPCSIAWITYLRGAYSCIRVVLLDGFHCSQWYSPRQIRV